MEKEVKENLIQSEFGHCVINWEIENYGYAAHGMEYELESPCFAEQFSTTLWRFSLKSDQGLCDDTEMLFYLERMDTGFDTVCVSYDVSLIDQNKKKWSGERGEHNFKPNDKHCLSVPNIYYGKVNVSVYNFHFMTIRCQMIVSYSKKRTFSDLLIDSGLKELSQDMDQLYKSKKFSDVIIKLDNSSEIVAHKAILSVRNKYMKDNFSKDVPPVLSCLSLHSDAMQQVLRYIYTGDIVSVVDNPSISVSDCINFLSIEELKNHFEANEMKLKSSIEVYQTGLIWRIENFSERNENCIVSDLISCDMLEMIWKLSLYPRGIDGDGEYLSVIAENVEGKINGNLWAKVEIYSDPYCRTWKTMNEIKQGEVFEIQILDSRKSALEKLEDDTLRIGFKACVSIDVTHVTLDQGINPIHRFPLTDYYKKLSEDIFQLRKDDKYSDVVIVSQGESFKAHKCILSARSLKFSNQLSDRDSDEIIHIENIRPKIIEIILDYIYSGFIEKLDLSVLLEVYEASSKFGANYLQQECSKYLCEYIDVDNVLKISDIACAQEDSALEKESLEFIKVNLSNMYEATLKMISLKSAEKNDEKCLDNSCSHIKTE